MTAKSPWVEPPEFITVDKKINPPATPAAGWDCHVHVFDSQAPVAPGHYQPVHRPLADIEALAQQTGFGHLVLVQPSVYGIDNSLLLRALRASPGRHRGVVVVDAAVTLAELQQMHQLGVRGIRFNLVSPVGQGEIQAVASSFYQLAPLLQTLGWHVQWYARPENLPLVATLHRSQPALPAVLDHLAGLHAEVSENDVAWPVLAELAALGAWVKLSGWYRLRAAEPYSNLDQNVQKVATLFDQRMVWGSDWPHTAFEPAAIPAYTSLLEPVSRRLSAFQQNHALMAAPAVLYG